MHPTPTTPLGQAIAAIIALLIAALAEHAAEHPVLAPGCRATMRQLQKLARRLEAMVAVRVEPYLKFFAFTLATTGRGASVATPLTVLNRYGGK